MTGWWTPGGGNLFTVAVAIIAIAVSAWFNLKTFRSTNEKFQHGRTDARNDKLREEIADFLNALSERAYQWSVFSHRMSQLAPQPSSTAAGILAPYLQSLRAIRAETLSDSYIHLYTHALAVEILTDDHGIVGPVRRISADTELEQERLDEVFRSVAALGSPADSAKLQEALKQLTEPGSSGVMVRERDTLATYVLVNGRKRIGSGSTAKPAVLQC